MSVGKEIAEILENKLLEDVSEDKPQNNWAVKRYSDEDNFKNLWEIPANPKNGDDDKSNNGSGNKLNNRKIIIVWDGFPSKKEDANSNVSLEQFTTPIDWALAYSLKNPKTEDTELNIVILDVYSHEFEYKNDEIKKFHRDCLSEMKGWVKFYSFNKKDYGSREPKTKSDKQLFSWPIESEIDFVFNPDNQKNVIEDLSKNFKKKVREIARENKTRHTISNILDPIQLAELTLEDDDFCEIYGKYPILTRAFYNNLKWHEVIPSEKDNTDVGGIKNWELKGAKVVLIDDHAKSGWEFLLNKWIYPAGGSKISILTKPDDIIDRLDKLAGNSIKRKYFNLSFIGDDENEVVDEILLFDLYLFPQYPPDQETGYFNKVIALAKEFLDKNGQDELNLKKLEDNIDNNKYRQKKRINYLTLLPRLIAEIDPSIPIIIFSSTEEDRNVYTTGPLKSYDNIDMFCKPSVFTDNDSHRIDSQAEAIESRNDFRRRLYV